MPSHPRRRIVFAPTPRPFRFIGVLAVPVCVAMLVGIGPLGCHGQPEIAPRPSRLWLPSAPTSTPTITPHATTSASSTDADAQWTAADWVARETPVTVLDLLALASAAHPRIRAAQARLKMALGDAEQAGLWPNPMLGVMAEKLDPGGKFFADAEYAVMVSQMLPIGGRVGAAHEAKRQTALVAAAELDALRWELQRDILRAIVELEIARQRADLAAQRTRLAQQLKQLTEQQVEAGDVADYVRQRVEIDAARAELAVATAAVQVEITTIRLLETAGIPLQTPAAPVVERLPRLPMDALSVPESLRLASPDLPLSHPALIVAAQRQAATKAARGTAEAMAVPDLTVVAGWMFDAKMSRHMLTFGFEIPLPISDRNQGEITAQAAREAEMRAMSGDTQLRVRAEHLIALHRLRESLARWRHYQTRILPATLRIVAAAEMGVAAGEFDAADVVAALSSRLEAVDASIMALEQAWMAAVDVYFWTADPRAFNPFGLPVNPDFSAHAADLSARADADSASNRNQNHRNRGE